MSTLVTGLAIPVAPAFATTAGASVGAGSGSSRIVTASAAAIDADNMAALKRTIRLGPSAVIASASRSRAAAPNSTTPPRPPPIAASVSATSTASRRTQISATSSP